MHVKAHASLDALPPELLESILIVAAANGDADSIASVAATCKYLFNTVYKAADRHLWRSLFCTTYDDPRSLCCREVTDFIWQTGFQDRFWTRRFITHHAQPLVFRHEGVISRRKLLYSVSYLASGVEVAHAKALRVLLDVIDTSLPVVPHAANARIALVQMDHTGTYRPVRLVQLHRLSGIWPPEVIPHSNSKNVIWLQDTLAHGLPSVLTANLVLQWVDWYAQRRWYISAAGLDFARLTTFLGLLPISETAEQSVLTSPSPPISGPRFKSNRRGDIDMSEDAQRTRALCMARERVFDMDYLVASRNWGPYLRVRLDHQGGDNNETDESDDDFDTTPPAGDQLLPDWSWLAAARIVASSVLRTHREDVRRRIEDWNNLREGAWLRPGASPGVVSESTGTGGFVAIDIQHSEQAPKRDWAGVEGVWRRLVCWFDYEDLLSFNADQRREASDTPHWVDDSYQEAWIIVPLSLRITGYSPCPIPEFADRPTIHVEGEMGGAEWLQEAATMGLDDQDVRRVYGTVTMLIDGNVRWSITSMDEDNSEDQWASEAIQLGGIGSAMGSLGMWTGVNHEQDDPLGVVWQWRVG